MKTLNNYFEYQKDQLSPNEKDFLAVLSKIEPNTKSAPEFIPAKTHMIHRITFAFSVFAVLVVFINIKEAPQKIAEKQSITEAVSTIDSVNSFDDN